VSHDEYTHARTAELPLSAWPYACALLDGRCKEEQVDEAEPALCDLRFRCRDLAALPALLAGLHFSALDVTGFLPSRYATPAGLTALVGAVTAPAEGPAPYMAVDYLPRGQHR
jgi:hypothetical protein